jgi:nucleoid-associated protein YgaU
MRAPLSYICTAVILSSAFLAGCDVNLPIKEMADARAAISKARFYQAEKYAPEEIKAADDALLLTHDNVKNEKEKEAIASANDAKAKADAALAKTLPLLSKDTIDDAKKILAEAKGLYSDEFAPDDTKSAEQSIADAEKSYNEKAYIPAYETALKSRIAALSARDTSRARIPALISRLAELETERDSLKNQNAAAYAGTELAALDAELAKAKIALAANSIKDGTISINAATELVDKINSLGTAALAQDKIARAESSLAKIKASPYAADVAERTAEAEQNTTDAKTELSEGNNHGASAYADEALLIIDEINIDLAKKDEEAKNAAALAKAENEKKAEPDTKSPDTTIKTEIEDTIHYIVQWRKHKTDCLWRIAQKLYRNARLWPVIYMANRDKIKDPDLIYPGQKLVIPPAPIKKKAWEVTPVPIPQTEPEKDEQAIKPDQPAIGDNNDADKNSTIKDVIVTPAEETDSVSDEPTGDTAPPSEDLTSEEADKAGENFDDAPADQPKEETAPSDTAAPSDESAQ